MDVFSGELWKHRFREGSQSEGSLQRTWSPGLHTFLLNALNLVQVILVQMWIEFVRKQINCGDASYYCNCNVPKWQQTTERECTSMTYIGLNQCTPNLCNGGYSLTSAQRPGQKTASDFIWSEFAQGRYIRWHVQFDNFYNMSTEASSTT